MTRRIFTLALFLTRNLFRTLLGILPPVLTLLIYRLTFTYRDQGDPAYLTAMGGAGLAFVGIITAWLVADRANRAAMYPLIARLPSRIEYLAAVIVSIVLIMLAMAVLYLALVLGLHHMTLTPMQLVLIVPRWLTLFVFVAALGLMMSKLASHGGSHIITFTVLGLMALSREQLRFLNPGESSWLIASIEFLIRPITDVLTASLETNTHHVLPGLALTLAYAAMLFTIATLLFHRKDLLWTE
jgi:hypothetical protein